MTEIGAYTSSLPRNTLYDLRSLMMGFDFMHIDDAFDDNIGYEKSRNLETIDNSHNFQVVKNGSSFVNLINLIVVVIVTAVLFHMTAFILKK